MINKICIATIAFVVLSCSSVPSVERSTRLVIDRTDYMVFNRPEGIGSTLSFAFVMTFSKSTDVAYISDISEIRIQNRYFQDDLVIPGADVFVNATDRTIGKYSIQLNYESPLLQRRALPLGPYRVVFLQGATVLGMADFTLEYETRHDGDSILVNEDHIPNQLLQEVPMLKRAVVEDIEPNLERLEFEFSANDKNVRGGRVFFVNKLGKIVTNDIDFHTESGANSKVLNAGQGIYTNGRNRVSLDLSTIVMLPGHSIRDIESLVVELSNSVLKIGSDEVFVSFSERKKVSF